jgi:putative transposase
MPQSLSLNYVHIVFSTKHRKPTIKPEIQDDLYAYIAGICKNLESPILKIGGIEDHIHILLVLSRKIALMKLIEEIKKTSSKWMKTKGDDYQNFYWQDGYGAFSVSPKHIDSVKNYIENQEEHHKKGDFKEEFLKFLEQYGIEYDERYIWD